MLGVAILLILPIFILLIIAIGVIIYFKVKQEEERYSLNDRFRKARRAESRAISFLTDRGYEVLDTQKTAQVVTLVDGRPETNFVRADALVTKGNRIYVVDVKTGYKAPNISNTATRRQLLEYYLAYNVDGVLLVNMTTEEIKKIAFSIDRNISADYKVFRIWPYIITALISAGMTLLLVMLAR